MKVADLMISLDRFDHDADVQIWIMVVDGNGVPRLISASVTQVEEVLPGKVMIG